MGMMYWIYGAPVANVLYTLWKLIAFTGWIISILFSFERWHLNANFRFWISGSRSKYQRPLGLQSSSSQSHACSGKFVCIVFDISMMIHAVSQTDPYYADPKSKLCDPMWPPPISHRCNSLNTLCHCFARTCRYTLFPVCPTIWWFCPNCRLKCHSLWWPFQHIWLHRCVCRSLCPYVCLDRRTLMYYPNHRWQHEPHPKWNGKHTHKQSNKQINRVG